MPFNQHEAVQLLKKCAETFRLYELKHKTKFPLLDENLWKAQANADKAAEIEEFLARAG